MTPILFIADIETSSLVDPTAIGDETNPFQKRLSTWESLGLFDYISDVDTGRWCGWQEELVEDGSGYDRVKADRGWSGTFRLWRFGRSGFETDEEEDGRWDLEDSVDLLFPGVPDIPERPSSQPRGMTQAEFLARHKAYQAAISVEAAGAVVVQLVSEAEARGDVDVAEKVEVSKSQPVILEFVVEEIPKGVQPRVAQLEPPQCRKVGASCSGGVCRVLACPVGSGGGPGWICTNSCGSGGGPGLSPPQCSPKEFVRVCGVPPHPTHPIPRGWYTPALVNPVATLPCCLCAVIRDGMADADESGFSGGGSGVVCGSQMPIGVLSTGVSVGSKFLTDVPVKALRWNTWSLNGGVPAATLFCYPWVVFRGWDPSNGGHGVQSGGLAVVDVGD